MICYKEVHKYNGRYYSRYDNGYEFVIGEIAEPAGNDYIYATDTIENVLRYAYVPFDIAILEMETIDEPLVSGYIVKSKKIRVIREVSRNERVNEKREDFSVGKGNPLLYALLQEKRRSILSEM